MRRPIIERNKKVEMNRQAKNAITTLGLTVRAMINPYVVNLESDS